MTDKIITDIDLFVLSTLEPTIEPSIESSYLVTLNNTSIKLADSGLTNYEKRIVIFTVAGSLILIFMLIALFLHIKSRLIKNKRENKQENKFYDLLTDNTTELIVYNNESNI